MHQCLSLGLFLASAPPAFSSSPPSPYFRTSYIFIWEYCVYVLSFVRRQSERRRRSEHLIWNVAHRTQVDANLGSCMSVLSTRGLLNLLTLVLPGCLTYTPETAQILRLVATILAIVSMIWILCAAVLNQQYNFLTKGLCHCDLRYFSRAQLCWQVSMHVIMVTRKNTFWNLKLNCQ